MFILGINSVYHESAACLLKDGNILAAVEEERLNRIKHAKKARIDNPDELPEKAIAYCLEVASKQEHKDIGLQDIDYIGFSFNPQKRLGFHLNYTHPYTITNDFGDINAEKNFYEKTMTVESKLRERGFRGKFLFLDHHDCHAASTFFASPFATAAVLVIDGIGECETTTLYHGKSTTQQNNTQHTLQKISSIYYPHSLGFLWEKFSQFLGFSEYDACKVMGLAAYGNPSIYRKKFEQILHVDSNGFFTVDDAVMRFRIKDYSRMEELMGLPKRNDPIQEVNKKTKDYADLAASLQEITETIILRLAKYLNRTTKEKYLCLAGGVALNCAANGKLIEENIFDDVFIQPAAHDAGTAIGAAFLVWHVRLHQSRQHIETARATPYLGMASTNVEIKQALDKRGLRYLCSPEPEKIAALLIAEGNIIAWHQGRMEIGPRALGNRSILADPRRKESREILNHGIKNREAFRPFCPSVLAQDADQWFNRKIVAASHYMLVAHTVKESMRERIPAVVHEDGTSRLHLVSAKTNQRYYQLLVAFKELTGIPLVLNTSFNIQEPIISSPEHAVATFLKSNLNFLIMGNYLIPQHENRVPEFPKDIPLEKYFEGLR